MVNPIGFAAEMLSLERLIYHQFSIITKVEGLNMAYHQLLTKIKNKKARVCIVGLGYVGLPTAAICAKKGYSVVGIDIKTEVVEKVNRAISPINEPGLDEIIREVVPSRLFATDSYEAISEADVVVVVVQTPLSREGEPDLTALLSASEGVAEHLREGALVVVESTVPPGTTRKKVLPLFEKRGFTLGENFFLAYSPERAIPTRTVEEIQTNPRIVGGAEDKSRELAKSFYTNITSGGVFTTDLEVAELVKVIENTYRDVNIALANEIALLCESLGIDAIEAIELANKHPRVNFHMPGAGVGGHCLPKDPHFLIKTAERLGIDLKLIKAARERNSTMPEHIVHKLERALRERGKNIKKAKIAILGLAYKGNTDDLRETPAKPIIKKLLSLGAEVFSHDPYAKHDFGGKFSNNLEEAVKNADAVVVVTDHSEYKKLDLKKIRQLLKPGAVVIDGRRVLSPEEVEKLGMAYYGVGR